MRFGPAGMPFSVAAIAMLAAPIARAQVPAFSGAEGFGGTFTGSAPAGGWFSNSTVYHVTTNQDVVDGSGKPLPGTLRYAFYTPTSGGLKQNASNVIVVFDVGGTFQLTNGSLDIKTVNNIYIAGQTAPSPVVLYGDTSQITHSSNTVNSNVILRYMTFRKGTGNGSDSVTFAGGSGPGDSVATNMIIDHVSATWSEDEVLSVANNNTNVTVQYSMMTDSLTDGHQYGSLIRPKVNSNVTYHHNLYGNDKSRNPRAGTYNNQQLTLDFRNNVIYNYSDRAGYTGGASEAETEYVNMNYVGNYVIAGPATPTGQKSNTAFTMDVSSFYNLSTNSVIASPKDPIALSIYQSGNLIDSNHDATRDGTDTGWGMFIASDGTTTAAYPDFNYGPNSSMPAKLSSPVSTAAVSTQSASDAYSQVMNYVGNNWWSRDLIDNRIIGNVQNNTQPAGGVPALAPVPAELTAVTTNPAISRPAGWDTDGDGMPDVWEKSMGLNPNSAADATTDFNTSGYVNVQKYLDEIGAFPAPGPLVFTGATNNRYAKITNWNMTFQPSRFDEVQINSGTALIDAIGQHAGTFKIATNAEDTASLNITSGWLQVENQLIIGGTATSVATLNLSGGELTAMTLSKGAGGVFNFTGGKLHAGTVLFDLMNQGGTIAPGNRASALTIVYATPVALSSIGTTHILGNLAMQSGAIEIELASAASYDKLAVDGSLTAGGNLNVSLVNSYKPAKGSSFDILDWGTLSGAFSALQLPDLNGRIIWDTSHLYGSGAGGTISVHDTFYAGDANRDSLVDVADISAMMTALADLSKYQTSNNLADPQLLLIANLASGDNLVNNADVQSLINLLANGGGSGALNAVPEPSAMVLSLLGAVAFMISLGCRRLPRS